MVKNIWKSYIWTADKDVNESDPRSNVHYLGSSENNAWKNSGIIHKYMIMLRNLKQTNIISKTWVQYYQAVLNWIRLS